MRALIRNIRKVLGQGANCAKSELEKEHWTRTLRFFLFCLFSDFHVARFFIAMLKHREPWVRSSYWSWLGTESDQFYSFLLVSCDRSAKLLSTFGLLSNLWRLLAMIAVCMLQSLWDLHRRSLLIEVFRGFILISTSL